MKTINEDPRPEFPTRRLALVNSPVRSVRPVTNLAKVFGQFAEVQQQVAEQVVALEESLHEDRQGMAAIAASAWRLLH